ncbi:MAG TPA: alpha/beta fold hydrolase [Streptosporangiaceae bacterium]|nr:alpha/beta fold hydrolase [Streptosporangiaceae bacterium]
MDTSESGFITAGGSQLYYETTGDGPAVLLIHGASVDLRMWGELVPALAGTYRVIRYDLRGLGRSARPAAAYRMADDAAAVLDHLGVAAAAVVGFSTGGAIAVELAARYPDRVRALVLIGAIAAPPPQELPAGWAAASDEARALLEPRERARAAGDLAAAVAADLDVWATAHHGQGRAVLEAWGTDNPYFHEMGDLEELGPVSAADLAGITAPALVIVGDQDIALSRVSAGHLAASIPGAQRRVFAGADHFVSSAQPAEFSAALSTFLADCQPAEPGRAR